VSEDVLIALGCIGASSRPRRNLALILKLMDDECHICIDYLDVCESFYTLFLLLCVVLVVLFVFIEFYFVCQIMRLEEDLEALWINEAI